MEETGIGVSFSKPVNLRFNSPEFLFLLKYVAIIFSKVSHKVMEKGASGVREGPLDAN